LKRLMIIGFALVTIIGAQSSLVHGQEKNTLKPCQIKFAKKRIDAECGTITVPENRQDSNTRLISLPVIRIPATGSDVAEPIFFLTGGPGVSNQNFNPPASLLEKHDFVQIGYRSIDGEVLLDCPEISAVLGNTKVRLFSKEAQSLLAIAIRKCNDRLRQEGIDIDGYNMVEVAEDIEAVRTQLGYNKIHLLSQSYGTRVAQIYDHLYAKHIYRSVMISVNPPGRFVWEPGKIDQQLAQIDQLCAADDKCRETHSSLTKTMRIDVTGI